MKMAFKLWGIVAAVAMIGFTFAACEGPVGPQGDRGDDGGPGDTGPGPELVVDINVNPTADVIIGRSVTLTASAVPGYAVVPTLVWEIYDEVSAERISLGIAPRIFGGNAVEVIGLASGEARILVTALGSGADTVDEVVTVTVTGLAERFEGLHDEIAAIPGLPQLTLTAYGNEPIPPQVLDGFGGAPVEITLRAGRPGVELSLADDGSMFTVGNNVTLVLDGITLRGRLPNLEGPLVQVDEGGTLDMLAGSRITGNHSIAMLEGGGVLNFGTFIMRGEIYNNSSILGGGVANAGTFIMHDGLIAYNFAVFGGGVANEGIFTMHGGMIYHNDAMDMGANTGEGGGVVNDGTFNMLGGLIYDNLARAGGGVANFDAFSMHEGAVIRVNFASAGGGVVNFATFNMYAGAVISANIAGDGGGVHNVNTFNMQGGAISQNTALGFMGAGGINNWGAGRTFRMSNGIIHGTDAPDGLGNVAGPAGMAVLDSGGAGTTAQRGTFDADGEFEFIANLGTMINLTLEVVDGEIPPVSASLPLAVFENLERSADRALHEDWTPERRRELPEEWFDIQVPSRGAFDRLR